MKNLIIYYKIPLNAYISSYLVIFPIYFPVFSHTTEFFTNKSHKNHFFCEISLDFAGQGVIMETGYVDV